MDALGLSECGLVGHSMGGAIASSSRRLGPAIVTLLVMAEGNIDGDGDDALEDRPRMQFVERGFPEQLARSPRRPKRIRTDCGPPTSGSRGSSSRERSTARRSR